MLGAPLLLVWTCVCQMPATKGGRRVGQGGDGYGDESEVAHHVRGSRKARPVTDCGAQDNGGERVSMPCRPT